MNTATVGLPPAVAVQALEKDLELWRTGELDIYEYDSLIDRSRRAFGDLVGTADVDRVSILSQLSIASGMVAASLARGDEVLVAEEDFTSVLFPMLARQEDGVNIRIVPLSHLLDEISTRTTLVAVSAAQSSDGRVVDLDALAELTAGTNTLTFVDTTQAAAWLPIGADRFSITAASAYKWLCCPRGSGFMTVGDDALERLRPTSSNWYASESPWENTYGPPLRLARSARRFDLSPAWSAWAAAAPTLELLAEVGTARINTHDVSLANRFRSGLGLESSNSAIVSFEREGADEALTEAGVTSASRAGQTRLSFHLYNTEADVDTALDAIART